MVRSTIHPCPVETPTGGSRSLRGFDWGTPPSPWIVLEGGTKGRETKQENLRRVRSVGLSRDSRGHPTLETRHEDTRRYKEVDLREPRDVMGTDE